MTIELSLVPASPDGNILDIVPGDMTGMPDADRLRFLQEAQEGRYSRLFAFEREPNAQFLMNDLEALRNYSRGVYILIQTERLQKNIAKSSPKHSKVFVGMTEDYGKVVGLYEKIKGSDQGIEIFDPLLTLDQCLMEQNQYPPEGMGGWELAIVIPEHENTALLYSMLLAIFDEAEGFDLKKRLHKSTKFDLRRMHDNHYLFFGNPDTKAMMLTPDLFPTDISSWVTLLCSLAYLWGRIRKIFGERGSSQKKKSGKSGEGEEAPIYHQSLEINGDTISNITQHSDNGSTSIQIINFGNFNADAFIKYLNNCAPPKPDTLSW